MQPWAVASLAILIIVSFAIISFLVYKLVRDASRYKLALQELAATRERFAPMLREQPGIIFKLEKAGGSYRYTFADGQLFYRRGLTQSDVGKMMEELVPEPLHAYIREIYDRAWAGESFQYETEMGGFTYLNSVTPIVEDGVTKEVLVVGSDITDRKRIERDVQESEERYRRLVNLSPDAIVVLGDDGTFSVVNEKALEVLGAPSPAYLLGRPLTDIVYAEYRERATKHLRMVLEAKETLHPFESKMTRLDGVTIDVEVTATWLSYRNQLSAVIIFRDITERKLADRKLLESHTLLSRLANIDGLTGIANRRFMEDKLEQEWELASDGKETAPLSVILCDIDCFKLYNDTYGHLEGDRCLQQVARALDVYVYPSGGFAARYGGEEFIAVLPKTEAAAAERIALELGRSVAELGIPHSASKASDRVTISLGVATVYPTADTSREALVQHADEALYSAKQAGRNRLRAYARA